MPNKLSPFKNVNQTCKSTSLLFNKEIKNGSNWTKFSDNTDRTLQSLIFDTILYGMEYRLTLTKIFSGKCIIQIIITYITGSLNSQEKVHSTI